MTKPFAVFIGGKEIEGYTSATLSRKKSDMTGSFSCELFFNYLPKSPVAIQALRGADVAVYVGGHLAFFGALDKRSGKGSGKSGNENNVSANFGSGSYTVSFSARGRTKYLVDSSHQHKTGLMKKPKAREVAEALTEAFDVELDWQSENVQLERVTFRDGMNVATELFRLGNENGMFVYETRDGKLRVTDEPIGSGEPLILGKNILHFSADQSEEHQRSYIVVKGQRTTIEQWGKDAIINTIKDARQQGIDKRIPFIIQHYGDGTPEALDRRVKFEADKRNSQALKVSVKVFHVMQSQNDEPWDIGQTHYVEIPPEGIFNELECIELEYNLGADGELSTTLTLAPPPSAKPSAGIEKPNDNNSIGKQKRTQLGVTGMDFWTPADIQYSPPSDIIGGNEYLGGIKIDVPPMKLPPM